MQKVFGIDNIMKCKICNSDSRFIFKTVILKKYNVKYYYCEQCGFLQTEEPYWLDEAYNEPINKSDTGILKRNINFSKLSSVILYFYFSQNGKYLDYAGGYGVFVRLMRDLGFDFYWSDLYTKNIFARGFEYNKLMNIDVITSFESFEHFVNPLDEIEEMLKISKNILFSTEILPQVVPKIDDWWYYAPVHGQHISFYSIKTLKYIAKKYGLNLYTDGRSFHLLTKKHINNFLLKIILKKSRISFLIVQKILKGKDMKDMFRIQS